MAEYVVIHEHKMVEVNYPRDSPMSPEEQFQAAKKHLRSLGHVVEWLECSSPHDQSLLVQALIRPKDAPVPSDPVKFTIESFPLD